MIATAETEGIIDFSQSFNIGLQYNEWLVLLLAGLDGRGEQLCKLGFIRQSREGIKAGEAEHGLLASLLLGPDTQSRNAKSQVIG